MMIGDGGDPLPQNCFQRQPADSGDQIYADDVAASMTADRRLRTRCSWQETLGVVSPVAGLQQPQTDRRRSSTHSGAIGSVLPLRAGANCGSQQLTCQTRSTGAV